ncbi:MAG: HTTM domain-containing protein [Deltaproteobacteria bacterium]|nr:HTTM domain-containing protein [Deltaproteobacteria bacterium]
MPRLEHHLRRFFFDPAPAHWAVIIRVGFGLVLLCGTLAMLPWWQELFGPEGLRGIESRVRLYGEGSIDTSVTGWLRLDPVRSPAVMWAVFAASTFTAACFTVGFWTRTAGVLAVLLHIALLARHGQVFNGGWPFMLHQFMAYLVLADCGRYASVDAWLRLRKEGSTDPWSTVGMGSGWPRRLLMVHLTTLYATAGLHRFTDAGWMEGSMVFVAMTYTMYGRFPDVTWFEWKPLLQAANYITVLLEPAAVVLLWVPRARAVIILLLLALHGGLELTSRTGWWQYVMSITLLVFVEPRWLKQQWDRRVGT